MEYNQANKIINGGLSMDCFKKIVKIVAIVIAVAAAVAGVYFAVKKFLDKKKETADAEENYVSCSCIEAEA